MRATSSSPRENERSGKFFAGAGFVLAACVLCATAIALKDRPFRLRYCVEDIVGSHVDGAAKLCELVDKEISQDGEEVDRHAVTMDGDEMAVRTTLRGHGLVISCLARFRAILNEK